MKEMTTIFSDPMGANSRFCKFQKKKKLILPQLSEFHIYCILLIFTGFTSQNYAEDYLYCKDIVDRNPWTNLFL